MGAAVASPSTGPYGLPRRAPALTLGFNPPPGPAFFGGPTDFSVPPLAGPPLPLASSSPPSSSSSLVPPSSTVIEIEHLSAARFSAMSHSGVLRAASGVPVAAPADGGSIPYPANVSKPFVSGPVVSGVARAAECRAGPRAQDSALLEEVRHWFRSSLPRGIDRDGVGGGGGVKEALSDSGATGYDYHHHYHHHHQPTGDGPTIPDRAANRRTTDRSDEDRSAHRATTDHQAQVVVAVASEVKPAAVDQHKLRLKERTSGACAAAGSPVGIARQRQQQQQQQHLKRPPMRDALVSAHAGDAKVVLASPAVKNEIIEIDEGKRGDDRYSGVVVGVSRDDSGDGNASKRDGAELGGGSKCGGSKCGDGHNSAVVVVGAPRDSGGGGDAAGSDGATRGGGSKDGGEQVRAKQGREDNGESRREVRGDEGGVDGAAASLWPPRDGGGNAQKKRKYVTTRTRKERPKARIRPLVPLEEFRDWNRFCLRGARIDRNRGRVGDGGFGGGDKAPPSDDELDRSCDLHNDRLTERPIRNDQNHRHHHEQDKPTYRPPPDESTADHPTDRPVAYHRRTDQEPGDKQDRRAHRDNNNASDNGQQVKGNACCYRRCSVQWSVEQLERLRAAIPPLGVGQQKARKAYVIGCFSGDRKLGLPYCGRLLPVCYRFFSAVTGFSRELLSSAVKDKRFPMKRAVKTGSSKILVEKFVLDLASHWETGTGSSRVPGVRNKVAIPFPMKKSVYELFMDSAMAKTWSKFYAQELPTYNTFIRVWNCKCPHVTLRKEAPLQPYGPDVAVEVARGDCEDEAAPDIKVHVVDDGGGDGERLTAVGSETETSTLVLGEKKAAVTIAAKNEYQSDHTS